LAIPDGQIGRTLFGRGTHPAGSKPASFLWEGAKKHFKWLSYLRNSARFGGRANFSRDVDGDRGGIKVWRRAASPALCQRT
jgi:hypothetical protein